MVARECRAAPRMTTSFQSLMQKSAPRRSAPANRSRTAPRNLVPPNGSRIPATQDAGGIVQVGAADAPRRAGALREAEWQSGRGVPARRGCRRRRCRGAAVWEDSRWGRERVIQQSIRHSILPSYPFDPCHVIEMTIPADNGQRMLASHGRDRQVCGEEERNRRKWWMRGPLGGHGGGEFG